MSKFEKFSDNRDQERNKQEERLRSQIERPHDGHIFNIFERARNSCPELSQQEIIDIFFDMQEYETLAKLSYQYSEVDSKEVATKLIEADQGKFVLYNLYRLLNKEDIEKMFQADKLDSLVESSDIESDNQIEDEDKQKAQLSLRNEIERPYGDHIFDIFIRAPQRYPELSQQEIIDIFFDMQEYETLAKLSYQYSDVDFRSVATRLVEAGQSKFVLQNIDKFATLEDVVDLLQEMNYLDPATKSEMNSDVFAGTNIKK